MKRIRSILYRYRLMTSLMALVVLLGALSVTPAEADGPIVLEGWDVCYTGCIDWNQQDGCVQCQACCSKYSTGEYQCWTDEPSHCA